MTKVKGIVYSLTAIMIGLVIAFLSLTLFAIYFQPLAIMLGLGLMFFGFLFLMLYIFRY